MKNEESSYEDFLLELYHAKLELLGESKKYFAPGVINQLNALTHLTEEDYDLEAHLLACQRYFQISEEAILAIFSACLQLVMQQPNKHSFTMLVYNQLAL